MSSEVIDVVENNDHLGQIISGLNQEQKNVDHRISKARNALYALLGPCFSLKCNLNPSLKLHIFRTFICPVLRSGLSTFVISDSLMESINLFQRKTLKGMLHVSKTCPNPAVLFILNELPLEAKIHRDIFSLFYSVWRNKNSKLFQLIFQILKSSSEKSKTWSNYLRKICIQYGINDPFTLLKKTPPPKHVFKTDIETRITSFHERELREKASNIRRMKYFNITVIGLSGKGHPAILNLYSSNDVKRSRYHLKMLMGDFYSFEVQNLHSGSSPFCKLCHKEDSNENKKVENTCHILASCTALLDIRTKYYQYYNQKLSDSYMNFDSIFSNEESACQFVLDPTSMNLESRINFTDPLATELFNISRNFCYDMCTRRLELLGCRRYNKQ